MAEIMDTVSPLLDGMAGAQLPIVVNHGEGRAVFDDEHKTEAPLFLRFTIITVKQPKPILLILTAALAVKRDFLLPMDALF